MTKQETRADAEVHRKLPAFENLKIAVMQNAPKITAVKTTVFDLEIMSAGRLITIWLPFSQVRDRDRERTRECLKTCS